MKKTLFTFLLIGFAIAYGQTNCESQRYISEVFSNFSATSGVYFGSDDPYGILSNQDFYLDVYTPSNDTLSKRPVIVHQYGGGYLIGWRSEPNIPDFAEMYTKRGFVFVSIDYRLGFNPLEAASAERAVYRGILDLKASLRFLKDNAATYGIDTNNIFLTGTSAGSISALGQTFMVDADRPSSTFGTFLEPTDLGCTNCTGNSNNNNKEVKIHGIINNWGAVLDTSLIDIIDDPEDNVPVISFHGTNDNAVKYIEGPPFSVPYFPSVQGSFLIHKRLNTLGIKNELHPLVGFGHEPQLLNPDLADTIVKYASNFLHSIMQGEISPIVGDTTVCLNTEVLYSVPLTDGSTYCWEAIGGTIINANKNEVLVLWNNAGTQQLKLNELNYLQVTKPRSISVKVNAPFNVNINYSSYDGLFNFNGNYIANGIYDWSFGDGSTGVSQTATHQYTNTGNFEVILEIENDFCTVSDTIVIVSDLCPIANFTAATNDSTLQLTNTANFYNNVYWNFGDGIVSNTDVNSHTYLAEGSYTVQMIVYNNFCIDTIEKQITISFCAIADFDYTINGLNVLFTNESFNNNSNFWNFGNGATNGTQNPSYHYSNPGSYDVQLIVFNSKLCSDTIIKTILITEKNDSSVAISKINKDHSVHIFPNPIHDVLNIEFAEGKEFSTKLFNLIGEQIAFEYIEEKQKRKSLDLAHLKTGVYILEIKQDHKSSFYKLIKQ